VHASLYVFLNMRAIPFVYHGTRAGPQNAPAALKNIKRRRRRRMSADAALRVRIWAPDSETTLSADVHATTTVREACGLPVDLAPPRAYLAHAHNPCFMQGIPIDAVLSDAIESFPLPGADGDRRLSLLTLHVVCESPATPDELEFTFFS